MRRQLMRPFTTMILLAGTAPHASAANSLCASAALRDENSSRTSRTLREIKSTTYIWDDWNIIREVVRESDSVAVTDNIWGLDLDGTLQGAGGVGGLLAVIRSNSNSNSSLYFPTFDANGNISEYISTNGEIVAHYDYSPFGEPLVASGLLAATFTHQFSTKPYCAVTGFSEYQMRKYNPAIGRWMSRDNIEEKGGINLFGFCLNNSVLAVDKRGETVSIGVIGLIGTAIGIGVSIGAVWDCHRCPEGRIGFEPMVSRCLRACQPAGGIQGNGNIAFTFGTVTKVRVLKCENTGPFGTARWIPINPNGWIYLNDCSAPPCPLGFVEVDVTYTQR